MAASMAAPSEEWIVVGEEGGDSPLSTSTEELRHRIVERSNLLNLTKLSIKALMESSMRSGRTLNDTHPMLQQFLVVLEHILKHRLKLKRSILGQKKSFWVVIESFEKISSEFVTSVASVKAIPGIRTMVGRGRAWLRFVLMQKKLGDHFKVMAENKSILCDWYEPEAVMMCDESTVIAGHLVGLNALDYNVMMKGDDFDRLVGVLDFTLYFRDGNYLGRQEEPEEEAENEDEGKLANLLDQKAYLEEHNRKLDSQVKYLETKLHSIETENSALRDTVGSLEEQMTTLGHDKEELRSMNERSSAELRKALENLQEDQRTELESHVQSRAGLSELYSATHKNLDTEMKLRQQLQQDLDMQRNIREEKETALQLLEKNTHEKQDTIVTLRRQLEELKSANLKIQSQLKAARETHQKDSLKIRSLEGKLAQLTAQSKQTEKDLQETRSALKESERTSRELGGKLQEIQLARNTAESDLAIEKQWRSSLQMEIQREKDRVIELTSEAKKYKALKREHAELQEKYAALQETVSEQEIGLVEMGRKLSLSQQKVSDMQEVSSMMKESVWVDDRGISDCRQCQKAFSVARRKHHCRNCGGIFCYACSDNFMQLASSSKPVRVCDSCYSLLLSRSSS